MPSTRKIHKDKKLLENDVEGYLFDEVTARGGFCVKLNPAWHIGIPDRLVVLPGVIAFVETKRPIGGRLRRAQKFIANRLQGLGAMCYVLSTRSEVDMFMSAHATNSQKSD